MLTAGKMLKNLLNRDLSKDETQRSEKHFKIFQHPYPLGKCKLKLLRNFILLQAGWPQSIKEVSAHAGKDAGKKKHLFVIGGSTKWYSHYGN